MAVEPVSGLQKMQDHLTCPVCLEIYANPRTLPCLHSFCQDCLEGLPLDKKSGRETYYLSCPTCRHHAELPEGGAKTFSAAFHLNNLKEVYYSLQDKAPDPQLLKCFDHDNPLDIFCESCENAICLKCAVLNHRHHQYESVEDCYPKHRQSLDESLNPVKEKVEAVKKALSSLTKRMDEIRERREGVIEEIHEMVERMINTLRQSERKLTEQVMLNTDVKLQVLSEQKKSAQTGLSLLEDVQNYVEQRLKTGTPQQILSSKKQMMECMSVVNTQIDVEELEPKEKDDLRLIKDSNIVKSIHHIGDIVHYSSTALKESKVISKFEHNTRGSIIVPFSLSVEAADSSLLSIPLSSLRCSLVPIEDDEDDILTTITTTMHPGVYRVYCKPSTNGPHAINVRVDDIEIVNTPLIVIPSNPFLEKTNVVNRIRNLYGPWGVTVSKEGYVIVAESLNNCITILDSEGRKIISFKEGNGNITFSCPRGVVVTPDNYIYVSDRHRVQKITMNGALIASVGGKGNQPLQFNEPHCVTASPVTGDIYIADTGNNRVQVLTADLTFSHSFGKKGSSNGEFRSPSDIAIDTRGLVYVADRDNHRIQMFTPNRKFVLQFGQKGLQLEKLKSPVGITITDGLVYVTDHDTHQDSIFTSEGLFLTTRIRYPNLASAGINVTHGNNFIYISDYINNRLLVC